MCHKFRTSDLCWLLAYPIYQIFGTLRHEGSHALVAMLEGARVTKFVFLPRLSEKSLVVWGSVAYSGPTSWLTTASPYFCDLMTFALAFLWLYLRPPKAHWVWINIVALGLLGPLFDSVWNYAKLFHAYGVHGDLNPLQRVLSPATIHLYFIVTIIAYVLLLILILKGSSRPQQS